MAGRTHKPFPIFIRDLEVVDSYPVTPGMHRVVLGGDQLGAFRNNGHDIAPFRTDNADDHVKLVIPDVDRSAPDPVQVDGHLDWPDGSLARSRDYTPRRFDPVNKRLELDFVRHDGGLAADWATSVQAGDQVLVAGPRGTTVLPDDIDWYFLVGDETALPAIARRIEELPPGTAVTAVVSIPTAADEQTFDHQADLDIIWIHRDRESPDAMMRAIRSARWLPGQVYAWAAGEAGMLRPIRRWFRDDRQVDRGHTDVAGYWRAGESQSESVYARMRFREKVDLAVPYAIRAAVTLGVAEEVADSPLRIAQLATRVGADPRGVTKIIRLLAHEGLFTISPEGVVALTESGSLLTEDFAHQWLHRSSAVARLDDGWPGMLSAVRAGGIGFEHATGRSYWSTIGGDDQLGASYDLSTAEAAAHSVGHISRVLGITEGVIVDVGGGTGALLTRLLQVSPSARGVLVDLPTTAERARRHFDSIGLSDRVRVVGQSFFEELPDGGDHYLLTEVLHDWPDAEATAILHRVATAAAGAPVHVVERRPTAEDHDHDLIADLQLYNVFGGGERTVDDFADLAHRVGLQLVDVRPVPEELQLLTFGPS